MDKIKKVINIDMCRSHRNGLLPFVRYGGNVIEDIDITDGNGNYGQYVCDFTIFSGTGENKKEISRFRYNDLLNNYDIVEQSLKDSIYVKKNIHTQTNITFVDCGGDEESKSKKEEEKIESIVFSITDNLNDELDENEITIYDDVTPLDLLYFNFDGKFFNFNKWEEYEEIKNKTEDTLTDEEVKIKTHVDLINNCKYFILVKKYDLVKSINNKWERWWKDNFKADGEWRNLIFDGYKKLNYPILKHDIFNFYFDVNLYILGKIEVPAKYDGLQIPYFVYYVNHNNLVNWFETNSAATVSAYESKSEDRKWEITLWEDKGGGDFYDFLKENQPLWQTFKKDIMGDKGKYFSYTSPYMSIETLINVETDFETLYDVYEYSAINNMLQGVVKPYSPLSINDIEYARYVYNSDTEEIEYANCYYLKNTIDKEIVDGVEYTKVSSDSIKTTGLTKQWLCLSANTLGGYCESKLNTLEVPTAKVIFGNTKGVFKVFDDDNPQKGQMFKCTFCSGRSETPKVESFYSATVITYVINENGEKEVSNVYNEPSKRLGSLEEEPPHTNAYQILNVKNIGYSAGTQTAFTENVMEISSRTEYQWSSITWTEYSWWECEKIDGDNKVCADGEYVEPNTDDKYRNVSVLSCIEDVVGQCKYGEYFCLLARFDNGNTEMEGKAITEEGNIKTITIPYKKDEKMNICTYDNGDIVYDKVISIDEEPNGYVRIVYAKGITSGDEESTSGVHYEEILPYTPRKKGVIPIDGVYMAEVYYDELGNEKYNELVYNEEYKLLRKTYRAKILGMEICTQWTEDSAVDAMLITKDGSEGLQTTPKYQINLLYNRGNASSWENHFKLSECNTLEDLENYGNNFFNF